MAEQIVKIREVQVKTLNEEVESLKNCVRILDKQLKDQMELLTEIDNLKHDLKEQKFCYELAASRAERYKGQLIIIKEALKIK